MSTIYFEIIGWLGTLAILTAYLFVSTKKITSDSKTYQYLNLFGALAITVNTLFHGALPSVVLNIIWAMIAFYGLTKNRS
jgi:hypothetical protein